jgi:hypothetical protein
MLGVFLEPDKDKNLPWKNLDDRYDNFNFLEDFYLFWPPTLITRVNALTRNPD